GAWRPRVLGGALPLWHGARVPRGWVETEEPEPFTPIVRLRDLWSYRQKPFNTWNEQASGVRGVAFHARPLPAAIASSMAQLRRALNDCVRFVGGVVRGLLGRYGADVQAGADAGAKGQREGLQSGELLLGDAHSASKKQTQLPDDRDALGAYYRIRGQQSVWN